VTREALQALVDSVGLSRVLGMLGDIAYEKAGDLRRNSQDADDRETARAWTSAGEAVQALADGARIQDVS